jgi:hypothetical protein
MRVSLPRRRRPTTLEQLLGKQRARLLRRRLGVLALGAGVSLLKPRTRWAPVAITLAGTMAVLIGFGLRPLP